MPINKQQFAAQRTKQLSILIMVILAVFLLLSVLNDNIFLDRLIPAAGIISFIVLIRNMEERH